MSAPVSVIKTVSPVDSVFVGETLTYTITVTNISALPVTGVINDALTGLLVSIIGLSGNAQGTFTSPTITLYPGQSATATIASAQYRSGFVSNTASFIIDSTDYYSNTVTTNVMPPPSSAPVVKSGPTNIGAGLVFNYNVVYSNVHPAQLLDI